MQKARHRHPFLHTKAFRKKSSPPDSSDGEDFYYALIWILPFPPVLFFTILAPVNFLFRISEEEHMVQSLLDGGNAAGIFAADDICEFLRQLQILLFHDFRIFDDIYRDVMVDKAQNVQIQGVDGALDLDDILFPEFVAAGIFDDSHAAVHLIQLQIFVNGHAFSCLDMIQNDTFVQLIYV